MFVRPFIKRRRTRENATRLCVPETDRARETRIIKRVRNRSDPLPTRSQSLVFALVPYCSHHPFMIAFYSFTFLLLLFLLRCCCCFFFLFFFFFFRKCSRENERKHEVLHLMLAVTHTFAINHLSTNEC